MAIHSIYYIFCLVIVSGPFFGHCPYRKYINEVAVLTDSPRKDISSGLKLCICPVRIVSWLVRR